LRLCEKDPRKRILITHGTDTMQKTGTLLAEKIKDKTIVLTGSMRPYYAENSDASFNLGSALVACQTLPPGVYVVLQGEVFSVDKVKKVRAENDPHFEEI
jgi:L-asparaginase